MPLIHEFGIINDISDINNEEFRYSYTPELYNCTSINDDIVQNLIKPLSIMNTYFLSLNRPELGLAYWGKTIIPPKSLPLFLEVIKTSKNMKQSNAINDLCKKVIQAIEENKYMIHFGV